MTRFLCLFASVSCALALSSCADDLSEAPGLDTGPDVNGASLCERAATHMQLCLDDQPLPATEGCDEEVAGEILALDCDTLATSTTDTKADTFSDSFASFACAIGLYHACPIPACIADQDEHWNASPAPAPEGASQCAIDALAYEGCGTCEYYRCREETAGCGPDGYLMGFGHHYCEAFRLVSEPEASPEAQQTLRRIRRCLVESLDREVPGDDCAMIEERGFASHPDCYIASGFCELAVSDWFLVLNTVSPRDLDFMQILITGTSCLHEWFGDRQ